ncbi:TolC family protein [Fulvivirga maritima]|uniref:TolC family protein n=1 Tax=Fulvivirga maritima TaxID=2904247 RepID=UPI001F2989AC|nr:TolC family protein [Fulvivirga maritima]UII26126.1 TolC family protein [Fulvivirga maritima]
MKKLYIVIFMVLSLPFLTQAQDNLLTLEDAIKIALDNNYSIKIARNESEIAENNYTWGNAGFLPTVTADYQRSYGNQWFEQQRATGDLNSGDNVQSRRQTYGATLNWTVFDGLKMFTSYDQLAELNQQSNESLQASIEMLIYDITSAYFSAAQEKERLQSFTSNVGLSEERLQIAHDKYDLGKASKLEFLQAQVDLNTDKSSLVQQRELLAVRKFELLRLMAVDNDTIDFVLNYELTNDTSLQLPLLLDNLEAQNTQLLTLKRNQTIALYNEKLAKGDLLPQVDFFAGYTHSSFETPSGFALSGNSNDVSYGVTASWTLFNGLNVWRQTQNAKIQHENSKFEYQNQLLDFQTTVKTTYINYQNNLDLLSLEEENLDVAKENNDIAQERYNIGLSNALELRESQINLINAEIRYQNAAFAAKQAEVQLKYLSGLLVE